MITIEQKKNTKKRVKEYLYLTTSAVFCSLYKRDKTVRRFVALDLLGIGCENDAIISVQHLYRVLVHSIPSRLILSP